MHEQIYPGGIGLGFEGTVVDGTYDSVNNTVDVVLLETYADFSPGSPLRGTLMTPMVGFQGGPQGGERAIMISTRGGWRVMLDQASDDSPQTPIGEWRAWHAKLGTTGAGNTRFRRRVCSVERRGHSRRWTWRNLLRQQGALTQAMTSGGFIHQLNDTTKTAKTLTPGGMVGEYNDILQTITHAPTSQVYTIVDGLGRTISHVVPSGGGVGLGDLFANIPNGGSSGGNLTRLSDVTELQGYIKTMVSTTMQQLALSAKLAGLYPGGLLAAYLLAGHFPLPGSSETLRVSLALTFRTVPLLFSPSKGAQCLFASFPLAINSPPSRRCCPTEETTNSPPTET